MATFAEIKRQQKANQYLKECIAKIEALGFEHYDIIPEVRLTNNYRAIGTAQDMNKAFRRVPGKRGEVMLVSGRTPLFRISVSRSEVDDSQDLLDVMLHEVIHTVPGCLNHGCKFKMIAAKANAAYGSNVTVTKREPDTAETRESRREDIRRKAAERQKKAGLERTLADHVGETFKFKRKTYTLTGFNPRCPKNSCELTDASGRKYKCPPALVVDAMGL